MLSYPDFKQKQILFVFVSRGDKLFFRNDNIVIKNDDGIKHQSSAYRLFAVFIVGNMSITTGLLQRAKRFGFSLFLMTHSFRLYASLIAGIEGNFLLRSKQYAYNEDTIARYLVDLKINQQIEQLKMRRNKTAELKQAIKQLSDYRAQIVSLLPNAQNLLGIEGSASKLYFKHMFDNLNWHGRQPRAKRDITNVLLDIGYTLLFHMIDALLNIYGFNTYKGVYHKEFYQRKSLVTDIMEPFRPLIDARIRKAFNLGQIDHTDFIKVDGKYMLNYKTSKHYVHFLLDEIMLNKEMMFLFVQRYYRAFMKNLDIENYPRIKGGEIC
jgi:CRISPR-associated protein Cas1